MYTATNIKLYSGEELLGEGFAPEWSVSVPAERRDYRMTMMASRAAPFDLATTVSAEWTFSSASAPPNEPDQLSISALRYDPKLDENAAAPAGQRFRVPVALQRNGGTTERPRDLAVEVSYDEGATWETAPLTGTVATLDHPADATTVSLRASASDSDGNTVKQTIIRAYHLK